MAASVEELKNIIVDLKMDKVMMSIPKGHCPYAYYSISNPFSSCDDIDCNTCGNVFLENMRKLVIEKVSKL